MAALVAPRKVTQRGNRGTFDYVDLPMAANAKIYPGAIVALSGGYAIQAAAVLGLFAVGVAEGPQLLDNTGGANGALTVRVRTGMHPMNSGTGVDLIAQANCGQLCYLIDDNTVGLTSGGNTRSVAGTVVYVDADGVQVQFGFAMQPSTPGAAGPAIQTGTVTLAAGVKTLAAGISISAGSKVFVSLNTPGGATQGVKYKVPDASLVVGIPGVGAFTVTATDNTGATVATDVSTVNYLIVG